MEGMAAFVAEPIPAPAPALLMVGTEGDGEPPPAEPWELLDAAELPMLPLPASAATPQIPPKLQERLPSSFVHVFSPPPHTT